MIKKTKDRWSQVAQGINEAIEYNKDKRGKSKISLVQFKVSRGFYNELKADEENSRLIASKVIIEREMGIRGEAPFELEVIDNERYCLLMVRIK